MPWLWSDALAYLGEVVGILPLLMIIGSLKWPRLDIGNPEVRVCFGHLLSFIKQLLVVVAAVEVNHIEPILQNHIVGVDVFVGFEKFIYLTLFL